VVDVAVVVAAALAVDVCVTCLISAVRDLVCVQLSRSRLGKMSQRLRGALGGALLGAIHEIDCQLRVKARMIETRLAFGHISLLRHMDNRVFSDDCGQDFENVDGWETQA
jgi:hypothetical protein